jgi:hypothetical protein
MSAAGPPGTADAPLAIDNDNPAAPNKGTAHARRFRFEACLGWDMVESPQYLFSCLKQRILAQK